MSEKPISITRQGDTETAHYADGRSETRTAHIPTRADWWPRGTGETHTPKPTPAPNLRSAAYTGGEVHLFFSDGSSRVVPNVAVHEWLRVRTATDRHEALTRLRGNTRTAR